MRISKYQPASQRSTDCNQNENSVTTKLQDFTPLLKIGQGSFSSVYKVRRNQDSLQYALKKVKIACLKKKQKQSALNQIRILASLQSKYIINYKQAFFDQKYQLLCIVMQLADQGDLYDRVKRNHQRRQLFAEKEIWKAIGHITKGLKVLHENNIMHRDLKSSNIFICNNVYKLGDLNVSKVQSHQRKLAFTQTGTPYYASPEVWRDQPYDFKSDIWSLGCIIYEMCQLKQPFGGENMEELYQNIQKGNFNSISPYYSPQLVQLINKCLSRNSRHRPSCSQLISTYGHNFVPQDQECLTQFQSISMMDPHKQLLRTIQLDQNNLGNLKNSLPKSKYETKKKGQSKFIEISTECLKPSQIKDAQQNQNQRKTRYIEQIQDIKRKYRVRNHGGKERFDKQRQKTQISRNCSNYSSQRYQKRGRSIKLPTQNSHRLVQSNESRNLDLKIKKRQFSNLLKIDSCPHNPRRNNSQMIYQKTKIRPKISNQAFNRIRALRKINPARQNFPLHYISNQQISVSEKPNFAYKSQDRYKNSAYRSLNENGKQQSMMSERELKRLRIRAEAKVIDFNPKIKKHIEHKLSSLVRSINSRSSTRQQAKTFDKQREGKLQIISNRNIRQMGSISSYLLNPQKRQLQMRDTNKINKTDVSVSLQYEHLQQNRFKAQKEQQQFLNYDFDDRQYRLKQGLLAQKQKNISLISNEDLIKKIKTLSHNQLASKNILSNIRKPYIQKVYPNSVTNQNDQKIDAFTNHIASVNLNQHSKQNYRNGLPKNMPRTTRVEKAYMRKLLYDSEKMIADRYFRKIVNINVD